MVLVYLRDEAIQNATTLAEILPIDNIQVSQTVATQMEASHGRNVLFIFDGWDEFPLHLQENSIVATIIKEPHKTALYRSTVLIASRPMHSGNLFHIAERQIEILGFTQHQIHEYIEKTLSSKSTQIQKLVQHLEEHPVIEGYCYVPLHVAILVHIFLTMKGALPTTVHKLFCDLVLCCIVRELETREFRKITSTSAMSTLDDLPKYLKSKLSNLCVLALKGILRDKVVFYQEDLRKFKLPAIVTTMGLLQAVEGLTLVNKSLSYNFLHLSIQELLAAYRISQMKSRKQVKKFKRMVGSPHFHAVLCYYSGFTKLANPAIQKFIFTHFQDKSCIADLLPLLHCFYEAQEPSLCKIVGPQFSRRIEINSFELVSSVDFLAIGYCVASLLTLSTNFSHLCLDIEIVDEQKLKLLLLELSNCPIGLTGTKSNKLQLYFRMQTLNENGIMSLASHLRQSPITCTLSIQNCSFECDTGLLYIWEALQTNSSLTELYITCGGVKCNVNDGLALKEMLERNNSLSYLNLSKMNSVNLAATFIFQGLQHNTTLVHFFLSNIGLEATEETACSGTHYNASSQQNT